MGSSVTSRQGSYRSFCRHSCHPFLRGWNTAPRHAPFGTTGLKSSNQVLRNPGGSIASISVRLAIPSRARSRLERHKSKAPLSSPFQLSVMRKPVQLSVTRTAYALRNNQPVSSRSRQDPSAAVPKWLVCCSEPSAATEQISWTREKGAGQCPLMALSGR